MCDDVVQHGRNLRSPLRAIAMQHVDEEACEELMFLGPRYRHGEAVAPSGPCRAMGVEVDEGMHCDVWDAWALYNQHHPCVSIWTTSIISNAHRTEVAHTPWHSPYYMATKDTIYTMMYELWLRDGWDSYSSKESRCAAQILCAIPYTSGRFV